MCHDYLKLQLFGTRTVFVSSPLPIIVHLGSDANTLRLMEMRTYTYTCINYFFLQLSLNNPNRSYFGTKFNTIFAIVP